MEYEKFHLLERENQQLRQSIELTKKDYDYTLHKVNELTEQKNIADKNLLTSREEINSLRTKLAVSEMKNDGLSHELERCRTNMERGRSQNGVTQQPTFGSDDKMNSLTLQIDRMDRDRNDHFRNLRYERENFEQSKHHMLNVIHEKENEIQRLRFEIQMQKQNNIPSLTSDIEALETKLNTFKIEQIDQDDTSNNHTVAESDEDSDDAFQNRRDRKHGRDRARSRDRSQSPDRSRHNGGRKYGEDEQPPAVESPIAAENQQNDFVPPKQKGPKCYNCRQSGHFTNDCPNANNIINKEISVSIPQNKMGVIIGPRGANINLIRDLSNCNINCPDRDDSTDVAIVTVTSPMGIDEDLEKAKDVIEKLAAGDHSVLDAGKPSKSIEIERRQVGRVIGPGGQNIRFIRDQTNCNVEVPSRDEEGSMAKITVCSNGDSLVDCQKAIDMIRKVLRGESLEETGGGFRDQPQSGGGDDWGDLDSGNQTGGGNTNEQSFERDERDDHRERGRGRDRDDDNDARGRRGRRYSDDSDDYDRRDRRSRRDRDSRRRDDRDRNDRRDREDERDRYDRRDKRDDRRSGRRDDRDDRDTHRDDRGDRDTHRDDRRQGGERDSW